MVEKTYAMLENGLRGTGLPLPHTLPPPEYRDLPPRDLHSDIPLEYRVMPPCTDLPQNLSRSPRVKTEEELSGICAGCGMRIEDRYYLLAVDKQWHSHCLQCSDCKIHLDSQQTCFAKDGYIFCKDDYYRRFGVKRCARCNLGISSQELVMRARHLVFHLSCFTCASCSQPLSTGDYYGLCNSVVYCRQHYELLLQNDFSSHPVPLGLVDAPPFYNGVGATQKGRPRKRKSPGLEADLCSHSVGMGSDDDGRGSDIMEHDVYPGGHPRQKRVRTSFKHHQLRTMKSYFSLNHNPDAKDLKQLAQKTGLPKRVLQVWFQNARAKYRRNLLKQDGCDRGGEGDTTQDSESLKDDNIDRENSCSPCMSDMSSSPSLSDLHGSVMESDHGGNSLPDLFSSSIASIN